jgi:hypothetical protein
MQKLFFVLFAACSINTYCQQFGGNPSSVKWKQLNTDALRIIFPAGMDSQANRVASIIDFMRKKNLSSAGSVIKKINLVMQNQTTVSNAYVGLGPYRSEFFMTPSPNNFEQGSIAWTDLLALHEDRHVLQFNHFKKGISKLLYRIAGDDGLAVAINAAVPDWFFEGDAVYQETIMSKQGRGRLPLFLNAYPALWKAEKNYSWMKLRNGSLKDYIPSHYHLGYLLVNFGAEKYGPDFWTKVTHDASAYKNLFYPFQGAVKKHAGIDFKKFREEALVSYKQKMEKAGEGTKSFLLPVNKKYVTSYYFPYSSGKDSLIYLKTSARHRPAFYLRDSAGEHLLKIRDVSLDEQFSYRNGRIVYAAYESDPRRGWVDYSIIKLLDVASGKERTITHKSKYFTPDISADGSFIAAVENNSAGKSEIHIIHAADGRLITAIRSSEISLFTDPKFIDDKTLVTAVRLKDGKMALALAELSTGNTQRLTSPSFNVVGYPCVSNGIIYFTASYEGNDDVFALRISDKKLFRVSAGPMGKYFVNAGDGKITWSEFTAEGYQLKQVVENQAAWVEADVAAIENMAEKFPVSQSAATGDILSGKYQLENYSITDYKKGTGLFNFHSWRPYYEDPFFNYSVYGENILNTFQTELYYLYNDDEKTNSAGVNAVYGALFPQLSAGMQYTFDRELLTGNKIRHWNQLDSRIGVNIPLYYAKGKTFRNLDIGTNYVLRNEFNKGFFADSIGNTLLSYLHHYVNWSQYVPQARQHIYPRLGYAFSLAHRYAVTKVSGNQFYSAATVYLPGFHRAHSLVLSGAFQERDTLARVVFTNRFPYSRGYTGRYFARMWKLSANYHFPLLYPDWGFGNILYINRVRTNAFYDFTKVYSRDKKQTVDQRSVGGEMYFDTRWWNQYPLTFGFRISHLLNYDQYDFFRGTLFEFILPVSIIPR